MGEKGLLTLMSFAYIFIEICDSICFFDTFLEERRDRKYRLYIAFLMMIPIAYIFDNFFVIKVCACVLLIACLGYWWYQTSFGKSLFLALVGYGLMFVWDFIMSVLIERNITAELDTVFMWCIFALVAKLIGLCIFLLVKMIYQKREKRQEAEKRLWLKSCIVPLVSIVISIIMFLQKSQDSATNMVYVGIAGTLAVMNFVFILMIQDIQLETEKAKKQNERVRQTEKQLELYRDMQEVYDRQRRKMHDYKKQLTTIQTLLLTNQVKDASKLLEELNGNMSVEMSAVNTNHPTVNAVLNQEIGRAKQKGISVMLKIDDLEEIRLREDEIVILLSNLLDNAVTACTEVVETGEKAVIHVKLVCEGGRFICAVKNPVMHQVPIANNIVQIRSKPGHGLGLVNVSELVKKYDGEMVLSCDDKEFSAVVML